MNYNLELAIRAREDKAKVVASSLSLEALRQWRHNHPQFETWYILRVVRAAVYDLRNQDGSQEMRAVEAIRTKYGSGTGGQVDQAVTVGFYGGRRDDPYIYALKGVEQLQEEVLPSFYAAWWRLGVKMALRWFASPWDDPGVPDSGIVLEPSLGLGADGEIIRTTSSGVMYWTFGSTLHALDLATEEESTATLGADISSLSIGEITGRTYATVLDFVEGSIGDEGYEDGYAYALAESGAFTQGQADCTGELGYRAIELAEAWAAANVPEEGSEDYLAGWIAGATAGFVERYNLGYESEGCVIP